MLARQNGGQEEFGNMGAKTELAGAYRYACRQQLLPIVETFRFRADDALTGGDGWTLSAIRESSEGTLQVRAAGLWEHSLHVGNWHRIVVTAAQLTWAFNAHRVTAAFELGQGGLRYTREGMTRTIAVPEGAILSLPVRATDGATIARVAQCSEGASVIELDNSFAPAIVARHYAAGSSRDTIKTLDGQTIGQGYVSVEPERHIRYVLSGDGMLGASSSDDRTHWRA
jgi:hypothetical protein